METKTACVHSQIELNICTTNPSFHKSTIPENTCSIVGNKCVSPTKLQVVHKANKRNSHPKRMAVLFELFNSSKGLKNFNIIFYFNNLISTRRFWALPSLVELFEIGLFCPAPSINWKRDIGIPFDVK